MAQCAQTFSLLDPSCWTPSLLPHILVSGLGQEGSLGHRTLLGCLGLRQQLVTISRELTPLEEASLQNQKLKAAYEARMARLDPSQALQKTSLVSGTQGGCVSWGREAGLIPSPSPRPCPCSGR